MLVPSHRKLRTTERLCSLPALAAPFACFGKTEEKCESVTPEKVRRLHHSTDVLAQFALVLLSPPRPFFLMLHWEHSPKKQKSERDSPPSFSCARNAKVSSEWRRIARDDDDDDDEELKSPDS